MGIGCGNCFHPIIRRPSPRELWEKTKSFFSKGSSSSGSISREEAYDPEKAQLAETARIQQALTDFRIEVESDSERIERDVIRASRSALDDFIEQLRNYNNMEYAGRKLNINISSLERDNRHTEDTIHGFIKKRVLKRASLDDSECQVILKMDKGEEKRRKMDAFFQKILRDAINELCDMLRKNMTTQSENVADRIQSRIDDIVRSVTEKSKKFKEVEKMKQSNEKGLEQQQAELAYLVSVCECGLHLCS